MMRYEGVSPDCHPLGNGKKSNLKTSTATICKEDSSSNGERSGGGKGFRFRSPSKSEEQHPVSPPQADNQNDVLLQWGHKKRPRALRQALIQATDESAVNKVQRRGLVDNLISSATMPLPSSTATTKDSSATLRFFPNRNLEERSGSGNGSPSRNSGRAVSRSTAGKQSPPTPEKFFDRKVPFPESAKDEKPNGSLVQADRMDHVGSAPAKSGQEAGAPNTASVVAKGGEKVNAEVIEWPRIYLALSRKEKEDDFLAMKGTKLPQRPKKRAKNIDKTLQYCFPGMWLSDLTKGRYEVREKKCVKKQKRRGLKGMESVDSESE